MICDLNLVSSPKYPSVSTASVTAGLAAATDAHGHNCPTDKTSFSLDLKTTTHSALHMLARRAIHPWNGGSDAGCEVPTALKMLGFSAHFRQAETAGKGRLAYEAFFFFSEVEYNNISMPTVLFLLSLPGGVVCCSGSQRTCISTAHCNLRRAHRHPASSIH